jgi:hypothetical protein
MDGLFLAVVILVVVILLYALPSTRACVTHNAAWLALLGGGLAVGLVLANHGARAPAYASSALSYGADAGAYGSGAHMYGAGEHCAYDSADLYGGDEDDFDFDAEPAVADDFEPAGGADVEAVSVDDFDAVDDILGAGEPRRMRHTPGRRTHSTHSAPRTTPLASATPARNNIQQYVVSKA